MKLLQPTETPSCKGGHNVRGAKRKCELENDCDGDNVDDAEYDVDDVDDGTYRPKRAPACRTVERDLNIPGSPTKKLKHKLSSERYGDHRGDDVMDCNDASLACVLAVSQCDTADTSASDAPSYDNCDDASLVQVSTEASQCERRDTANTSTSDSSVCDILGFDDTTDCGNSDATASKASPCDIWDYAVLDFDRSDTSANDAACFDILEYGAMDCKSDETSASDASSDVIFINYDVSEKIFTIGAAGRSDEVVDYEVPLSDESSRGHTPVTGTSRSGPEYDISSSYDNSERSDFESSDNGNSCEDVSGDDDADHVHNDGLIDVDDEDDLKTCPVTCPCKRWAAPKLARIEREMTVVQPLLKTFLQYRTTRRPNRLRHRCCQWLCMDNWRRVRRSQLDLEYDDSDLKVEYYPWGTWKQEKEKEVPPNVPQLFVGVAPEGCNCSLNNLQLQHSGTTPMPCVCNPGGSMNSVVEDIKRKRGFRVLTPLYQRVLQRELLRDENRLCHMCCGNRCALYHWGGDEAIAARQIKKDYHRSDLSVTHFRWGVWKPGEEEDDDENEEDVDKEDRERW